MEEFIRKEKRVLMRNFDKWLLTEPPPKSVKDIQNYWRELKWDSNLRILEESNLRLRELIERD